MIITVTQIGLNSEVFAEVHSGRQVVYYQSKLEETSEELMNIEIKKMHLLCTSVLFPLTLQVP